MNRNYIYVLMAVWTAMIVVGCSTKKNTANTRFYHAFTARYNTYYNGHEAYKEGLLAQETANKDNYMEVLPYFLVGNKRTAGSGGGDFDRAIEKSQKAIKQHSIKKKPVRKPGQKKTEKMIRWFAKKEYNPFIHKAWFMMGQAQFQKGEFLEAASTFSYISRLYSGEPDKVAEARLWMARCYTELEWFYDAEDVLGKAARDSMPRSLEDERSATYANLLLRQGNFKEALPYLEEAVKKEKGGKLRARHYYLLGQIYQATGDPASAYKAFARVIKANPPYELEFNARIKQTEVASASESERTIKRLKTMARSPKNEDFLDQIYYAIGNVCLVKKDTAEAVKNYESGVEKSTRNGVEKGILLLQLGDIYWAQADYSNAQRCYAEVIGLLEDKESERYKTVSHRSEVLDELVGYAEAVELQDSLQELAAMPEEERLKVIEKIIERVKEEEEKARKDAEYAARLAQREQALASAGNRQTGGGMRTPAGLSGDKSWYFYNQQLVAQGKGEFGRKWGRRQLEDNWRRSNKTVVNTEEFAQFDYAAEDSLLALNDSIANDSLAMAGGMEADSLVTDNKDPRFYIQQIPLTEEAMAESDAILSDGIYHCALIYKDKLEDFSLAEKSFGRLMDEFPDFTEMEEVYYNLYLMYSRWGKSDQATAYLDSLKSRFPEGDYTVMLSDPEYELNAVYGKHIEDSLYVATYAAYNDGQFAAVRDNVIRSGEKYPLGKHRPKFMFLDAMACLEEGNQKAFLESLKAIIEKYPENEITELAGMMLKGVQEGRLLRSGSFSVGSIWSRRKGGMAGDSLAIDSIPAFTDQQTDPYLFILAYEDGAVNENQLLFEIARYNFTNFMVRNFDIEFVKEEGIAMMQVGEFMNFMECNQYMKRLFSDEKLRKKLEGLRVVLISKPNYQLLQQYYSFDDYQLFYEQHLGGLPMPEMDGYSFDEPRILNADEAEKMEEEWEEVE